MKKLYLSFIALLCTLGTFAQSTVENINQPKAMKPIITDYHGSAREGMVYKPGIREG